MINEKEIRSKFPALASQTIFMDNAGGSQLPDVVIKRINDYMVNKFVQLGADYEISKQAGAVVDKARELLLTFFNGVGLGKVVMGPSSSALCAMLADCYRRAYDSEKNEIIICETGHEANVGPWIRLQERGYVIKTWKLNPQTFQCSLDELQNLVTEKTKIVAFPHVSNLLGEVVPAKEICRIARQKGARVVIDGVAYAPHRAIDVAGLEADFYVFSNYKVFGPHMAALFGRDDAFAEITGPNHYFIKEDDVPYKFELGGVLHEGCAGILGLWDYFCFLTENDVNGPFSRNVINKAYTMIENMERQLTKKLLDYLKKKKNVTIIGSSDVDEIRVSTVSFIHRSKTSREIAIAGNEIGLGFRYGHFYAHRLCQPLGLDPEDAVVRISLVHYNSLTEIDKLCEFFDTIL